MKYRYFKLINGYPSSFITPQDMPIANYKELFGSECLELVMEDSDYLKERYVFSLNKGLETLRECTEYDRYKYDGDAYKIPVTHYYKKNESGEVIDILPKPTHNYLHPVWNDDYNIWLESATDVEIVNYDSSSCNEIVLQQERALKTQISLGRATKTFKNYDVEKEVIEFNKSECMKFQQAGSDFLNNIITFEDYEIMKSYINDLLKGIEHTRPVQMEKYDPQPTINHN